MKDVHRRIVIKPRGQLFRTADGQLRQAGEERDIADIWAEQRRIQLKEAILRDEQKAAKKQRRRERGLFGLKKPAVTANAAPQTPGIKEIEIKISIPKVNMARLLMRAKKLAPRLSRKQQAWTVVGVVLIVFVVSTQGIYHHKAQSKGRKITGSTGVSGATAPVGGSQPQFATVLPAGKTIEQLGGWGRVSPPDKNPVFAYSDMLSSVHIVVSEQPLPDTFSGDTRSQLSHIGKQFNATRELTMDDGTIAYIGASASGAQSVVASKNELLILVRSASKIDDQSWTDYLQTLQ